MGLKLSELEPGSRLFIVASKDDNKLELNASIVKIVKEDVAIINIESDSGRRLNFENVTTEVIYAPDEGVPFIWRIAKIVTYQSQYVLQVKNDAVRNNRRACFRVGVSKIAKMKMAGKGEREVMVRDVSLSGFGLTDRDRDLLLKQGDEVTIYFEDRGHSLNLAGRLVRIVEFEEYTSYGFTITNLCKDLASYITTKQRQKG